MSATDCGACYDAGTLADLPSTFGQPADLQKAKLELAWDQRSRVGLWRAYLETSLTILKHPVAAFEHFPPQASFSSSMQFALLATVVGFIPSLLAMAAIAFPLAAMWNQAGQTEGLGEVFAVVRPGAILWGFAGYAGLLVLLQMFVVLALSAFEHWCFRLIGVRSGSYLHAVRAASLSMAPNITGLVPVVSLFVFPTWSLIIKVFAFRGLYQTTALRSVAAIVVPSALFLLVLGVAYVVWMLTWWSRASAGL